MNHDDDDDLSGGDGVHPYRPWDPEIGYGRPPKATRFKPGQSGNPNGRPKGAKTRRFASGGYTLRDALLAETERIIVIQEGDQRVEMTQLQVILRRLGQRAMLGGLKEAELFLMHTARVQQREQRQNERFMEVMTTYKVTAEAEVRRRQAKGITDMSDILPHPDQVHIDMTTGEVLISGPMTAHEAAAIEAGHEALLEHRKALAQLDALDLKALPPNVRQAVADMRHAIETEIQALSEALGEPYL